MVHHYITATRTCLEKSTCSLQFMFRITKKLNRRGKQAVLVGKSKKHSLFHASLHKRLRLYPSNVLSLSNTGLEAESTWPSGIKVDISEMRSAQSTWQTKEKKFHFPLTYFFQFNFRGSSRIPILIKQLRRKLFISYISSYHA